MMTPQAKAAIRVPINRTVPIQTRRFPSSCVSSQASTRAQLLTFPEHPGKQAFLRYAEEVHETLYPVTGKGALY